MNQQAHPSDQELARFAEMPAANGFAELRRHLLLCADCRALVDRMARLPGQIRDNAGWLDVSVTDAEPVDPHPLDALADLHAYSHARDMRHGLEQAEPGREPRSRWWNLRLPVWQLVPAAAVVMLAVALVVATPDGSGPDLLAYRDSPDLVVQTGGVPGMGFFDLANRRRLPFEAVTVEAPSADSLHMQWPGVDGNRGYLLELYRIQGGQHNLLRRVETDRNQVDLQLGAPLDAGRYEWRLSGATDAGHSFAAEGGFVVAGRRGVE